MLENNRYAQSTSQTQTLAGDIEARAAAFGIETSIGPTPGTWRRAVDGCRGCVEAVRHRGKPRFLRIDTYRLMAHSKGDDDRDPAEVKTYWDQRTRW